MSVMRSNRPYSASTISDIAIRVFAERGYDGARMEDIAHAAGLTKASLYHHVRSKEEFLKRGAHLAFESLNELASQPVDFSPLKKLRSLFINSLGAIACDEKLRAQIGLLYGLRHHTIVEMQLQEHFTQYESYLASLLEAARSAQEIDPKIDVASTAHILMRLIISCSMGPHALNSAYIASLDGTLFKGWMTYTAR